MLISIIVPVYNAEKFLQKCIESVIKQNHSEIELILVDDGSNDNSINICKQYGQSDNRLRIISQKNKGPAAARNSGIKIARGEYIFLLDADDFIDRDSIKTLVAGTRDSEVDLVMGNFSKIENDSRIIPQKVSFKIGEEPFSETIRELTQNDNNNYVRHFLKHPSNHLVSYCWARLYKTDIIKKHNIFANEKMQLFEDFIFNLEYLKYTEKTVFINQSIYNYVMHNNHVSASMAIFNAENLLHDMAIFRKRTIDFFKTREPEATPAIVQEIGHALTHYAIIFIVRSCRLVNRDNRNLIHREIGKLTGAPLLKNCLRHYRPAPGNSRLLPLLMKTGQVNLIILFSNYKARKRYGRLR